MRGWAVDVRRQGHHIALVPTMGALHRGHLALVEEARQQAQRVVVSIFVNPLQFGAHEDLSRYPRTWEDDLRKLEGLGVNAVFHPDVQQMYPDGGSKTWVRVDKASQVLCGRSRPEHFQGVTTVVAKLFNIVQPDCALFGEKDWQQLIVVRQMVHDLNLPVRIVGVATVREPSGLALSSRNQYLSEDEHSRAAWLYGALIHAHNMYQSGVRDRDAIRDAVLEVLSDHGLVAEYVEVVDPATLEPSPAQLNGAALVALAVPLGRARLIDNILLTHQT